MSNYKLTKQQRFELPFVWLKWLFTGQFRKVNWHTLKKSMEIHECSFTMSSYVYSADGQQHKYLHCSHEGCNQMIEEDYKAVNSVKF